MADEALHCPRDGAKLGVLQYEGVTIDTCPTCRGTWLDRGELEKIQETEEEDTGSAKSSAEPPSLAELAKRRRQGPIECPKCGGPMETREHGFASQVHIDSCIGGCGQWLDEGELQALERFFEENRDNKTLPLHWRAWASVVSIFKR
jgi:hypothetical protein